MTLSRICQPIACLGLFALVGLAAGCGGKEQEADEAVVVTEPGKEVPTASSPAASTTAPAASTPAAATPSTPAAPAKAEGYGSVKGQVTFNGNPTAPKELVAKGQAPKDPAICAKDAPIESERLIIDGGTKGVKNALVYIPKPNGKVSEEAISAVKQAKVEFDQKHCSFEPHVLALMAGTEVDLKNSDPINHNINSRLKNNQFNKLISGGQSVPNPIETAERTPGQLTCDIHPWMSAYWMVLDNPYFAVTDDKGNYEIKDVPAGAQKVVVWQESVQGGFVTPGSGDVVTVKANDTTTKDFKIDAGKVRPE
ncbi:MAG: hypothetical protein JO252_22780 [Planctomycetaceae bacterium]|nr:hypothetical protein [Planctomycetaceae bacterium]